MKDVSDYIIKSEDGNFYLDAASHGRYFTFCYDGRKYRGYTVDENGDGVARVYIF